jgi:hypothetical protein
MDEFRISSSARTPFTGGAPAADSSIAKHGVITKSHTDRTITDRSALDIITEKMLLENCGIGVNYDPPEVITFEPWDIGWALQSFGVGDIITINDADSGLSGPYRVYGKKLTYDNAAEALEFTVSNSGLDVLSEIKKATDLTGNLTKYMQGATNIFTINETENASSGNPIDMFFEIPSDAIAINKVKLSYRNEAPRIWNDTTATQELPHVHDVEAVTSYSDSVTHGHTVTSASASSSRTAEFINKTEAIFDQGITWDTLGDEGVFSRWIRIPPVVPGEISASEYLADANTMLLYHLLIGDGAAITDSSTYSRDGTGTAITLEEDIVKIGTYSAKFNGSTSKIIIPRSGFLSNNMTIEMWVYSNGSNNDKCLFRIDKNGAYPYQRLVLNSSGVLVGYYRGGSTDQTLTGPILPDGWNHIALTTSTTTGAQLILNGTIVATSTVNANVAPDNSDTIVTIGCANSQKPTTYHDFFNGWIDEVRVSNNIRTFTPESGPAVFAGCIVTVIIQNKTGSPQDYSFRLIKEDMTMLAEVIACTVLDDSLQTWNYSFSSTDLSEDEEITLEIFGGELGTDIIDHETDGLVALIAQTKSSHSHTISSQAAESQSIPHTHLVDVEVTESASPEHSHDNNYEIAAKGYTTTAISIYTSDNASASPSWTDRTSEIESELGRTLKYQENESEFGIDVTDFFSTTGWKGIRIEPNGDSRHKTQVTVKCFIKSI